MVESYLDIIGNVDIKYLMYQCYVEALNSQDPSTQNGALLYCVDSRTIIARACNTFPKGVLHKSERWNNRELKYSFVGHAESNALFGAFRNDAFARFDTKNVVMICPWAACCGCAKTIIGFGIKGVIVHKQRMAHNHGGWKKETEIATTMLKECGILYELYDGLVDDITIRKNGKQFNPNCEQSHTL